MGRYATMAIGWRYHGVKVSLSKASGGGDFIAGIGYPRRTPARAPASMTIRPRAPRLTAPPFCPRARRI